MANHIAPPVRSPGKYKIERKFEFLPSERKQCIILIVERDEDTRSSMRSSLKSLGFGEVISVLDHYSGVKKFSDRRFTHVLFDARDSEMPAREFLKNITGINRDIVTIPTSLDPTVDDVFELLKEGARGFLVKPFTEESLEEAIILAAKGEPIAEEILYARNRNQALASLALTSLDALATILRHARQFETARLEVKRNQQQFERAVQMGRLFAQDGDASLVLAYIERAIEVSEQSASRLGRSRKRRHKNSQKPSDDYADLP